MDKTKYKQNEKQKRKRNMVNETGDVKKKNRKEREIQ